MFSIVLVLILLSFILYYCTQYKSIKEGIGVGELGKKIIARASTLSHPDTATSYPTVAMRMLQSARGIVNPDIKFTPLFQSRQTEADIKKVTVRMKQLQDSKELAIKNKADLESLNTTVDILDTLEELTPQNTTNIATLTAQINSLGNLEQNIADVSSTNRTNTKMIHKLGKRIQQIGLKTAMPEGNPSPPPKGTGSSWPPPGGFAGR
jgi:hypothetical protein